MIKLPPAIFIFICLLVSLSGNSQGNYLNYHREVIESEQLIVEGDIASAVTNLDSLFDRYDFHFLRDIQLAAELSAHLKDNEQGMKFLRMGIQAGWELKSIKKNKNLKSLRDYQGWKEMVSEYDILREVYTSRLNIPLWNKLHEMYKKDQNLAFKVFFRFREKSRERYMKKIFTSHSERQLQSLDEIIRIYGYPGEKLIGNNTWASVILSHHNSFSPGYTLNDILYPDIRPKLLEALERGEMSPYEFAQAEDWKAAVLSGHESTSYGFIGKIAGTDEWEKVNQNRAEIGLRSIELRNKLIEVEESTGLNLYLPKDWKKGRIAIDE